MTPYEIREGLATGLRRIDGLTVSMYRTGNVSLPHAVVGLANIDYDATMGRGSDTVSVQVLVYVARADDAIGQASLDEYMAGHGPKSVKSILETKTKTGLFDAMVRVGRSEAGTTSGPDGAEFLALTFDVSVVASGLS